MADAPDLPIRRNTALLSGSLATNSATLQLAAAVASLTLVRVLHVEGLLGLGPAVVLQPRIVDADARLPERAAEWEEVVR